jgi:hypothetical protein
VLYPLSYGRTVVAVQFIQSVRRRESPHVAHAYALLQNGVNEALRPIQPRRPWESTDGD